MQLPRIIALLVFALLAFPVAANRIETIYGKPADSLLVENFLYEAYWAQASAFDIDALADDEQYLAKASIRTNDFFDRAFEAYYARLPLNLQKEDDLLKHTDLGIALLKQPSMALQIQGDRMLQELCNVLQNGMEKGDFDAESEWMQLAVAKLKAESYHLKPPTPSDTQKATEAITKGNFSYLSERLYSRCVIDCESGNCGTPCLSLYIGASLLVLLVAAWVVRWVRK